ncbi:MAG TPA: heterocyst frequency control protein PatD [Xenococcaceae cyanobacterium]
MLSFIHQKAYQEFLTLLSHWQNLAVNQEQIPEMSQSFAHLQQYFQQEIMILTDEELDNTIVAAWRSLQTEIQREFRLLSTDLLFLNSSRQASTRENRLQTIRSRLTRLITYCQNILTMAANHQPSPDNDGPHKPPNSIRGSRPY